MIEIRISFSSLEAAASFLSGSSVAPRAEQVHSVDPPAESVAEQPVVGESVEATAKRKRRTKAEMEAARQAEPIAATPVVEPAVAPTVAAPVVEAKPAAPVTKEVVRAALGKVNASRGIDSARGILMRFGTTSLSGLNESQYSAFIARCEEVAAGGSI